MENPMTGTHGQRYRSVLQEYLRRARQTADRLEEQVRTPTARDNLSDAPMHLGDLGTEEYAFKLNATLFEQENHILAEVIDALARIDQGTFGRCENCGQAIPDGRLETVPYARYCVPCTELLGAERPANVDRAAPASPPDIDDPRDTLQSETDDSELYVERIPAADLEPAEGHPDRHAIGTPGGGTSVGGLAGTNIGDGAPGGAALEDAADGGFDITLEEEDPEEYGGPTGGAVGGTPANKRARGGWAHRGLAPREPDDHPTGP
jgi:RNA polymerase-binding transcription factor DksA